MGVEYYLLIMRIKAVACALVGVCLLAIGCRTPVVTTASELDDYSACVGVIKAAFAAFNSYDLEKCLGYLSPEYAEEARPALADNLEQFKQGRAMGIHMVPVCGAALTQTADTLSLPVTMQVRPGRLHGDEHYIFSLTRLAGVWRITGQAADEGWRTRTVA